VPEFGGDVAAPDDNEAVRRRFQLQRPGAGQVVDRVDAVDGRLGGGRAGRDEDGLRPQPRAVVGPTAHLDRPVVDETRLALVEFVLLRGAEPSPD
jgi:hypothetical protein